MKITRIETRIVDIPVTTPYVFSHGVMKAFSNVLVWIHADGGLVGIGEASFTPGGGVTEETPEATKPMIDCYFAPVLIGEDPFDVERAGSSSRSWASWPRASPPSRRRRA